MIAVKLQSMTDAGETGGGQKAAGVAQRRGQWKSEVRTSGSLGITPVCCLVADGCLVDPNIF